MSGVGLRGFQHDLVGLHHGKSFVVCSPTHPHLARWHCVTLQDPRIIANLKAMAEAAKIELSSKERVTLRMPVAGGLEIPITRQLLESLTTGLFRRARLPLDQACWQAGVDLGTAVKEHDDAVRASRKKGRSRGSAPKAGTAAAAGVQIRPKKRPAVTEVLLVGGATRMPAVQRFVRNMTGLEAREFVVDPDLAVALGAGVQAGILEGQVSNLMVMDVWQASLMRAFAKQLEKERAGVAAGALESEEEREEEEGEEVDNGSDTDETESNDTDDTDNDDELSSHHSV
jgi:heat shock 70kDa protein 1/2/6/8